MNALKERTIAPKMQTAPTRTQATNANVILDTVETALIAMVRHITLPHHFSNAVVSDGCSAAGLCAGIDLQA